MQIGTLGSIVFEVSHKKVLTLQELKRSSRARYATHQIISMKPKVEYLGPELSEIDFQITLGKQLGTDPLVEIKKIKKIIESGKEQRLMIGSEDFGNFVIESMSEDWQHFSQTSLFHAVVSLKLKEYN